MELKLASWLTQIGESRSPQLWPRTILASGANKRQLVARIECIINQRIESDVQQTIFLNLKINKLQAHQVSNEALTREFQNLFYVQRLSEAL